MTIIGALKERFIGQATRAKTAEQQRAERYVSALRGASDGSATVEGVESILAECHLTPDDFAADLERLESRRELARLAMLLPDLQREGDALSQEDRDADAALEEAKATHRAKKSSIGQRFVTLNSRRDASVRAKYKLGHEALAVHAEQLNGVRGDIGRWSERRTALEAGKRQQQARIDEIANSSDANKFNVMQVCKTRIGEAEREIGQIDKRLVELKKRERELATEAASIEEQAITAALKGELPPPSPRQSEQPRTRELTSIAMP